jgi:uncharacterized protein YdeI (YjbR/CyaY-like superfamily)
MKKSKMNPAVDAYLREAGQWREEMVTLRRIILDCGLTEELKWGKPCYSFQNSNIVLIAPFKPHCTLLVCKGVLLKDAKGILIKPGENSQSTRQIRFTSVREIVGLKSVLKAYIHEAVEVEKAGLEVVYKKPSEFTVPEEFRNKLDKMPALKTAYEALTPGRQRQYLLYFSGAKQSKTRETRVEKCMPRILKGKGMDDE